MRDLNGTVVWLTGAGTGIGRAGAEALAGAGATVVLSGRREAELQEVARTIGAAGGRAEVAVLDVADQLAVAATAERLIADHGRLDILVNNAGINVSGRHWDRIGAADWDRVVAIDLNGAFYCTAAVLPQMRAQGDGLVINVASWAGRHVSRLTGPAYTSAKHGMVAMSQSLNLEEGANGIRACAICPGEVATPILDQRPVPVSDDDKARMLQAEDLGATILFVAQMPGRVCLNEILISPTWNRINNAAVG